MDEPELLIDWLYKMSFAKERVPAFRSNKILRKTLTDARRFVLDDAMSSFLADVDTACFDKRTQLINVKAINQTRMMARSPHATSWIEYDFIAYQERLRAIMGDVQYEPRDDEAEIQEGWLIDGTAAESAMMRGFMFRRCTSAAGLVQFRWFPWGIYWMTNDETIGLPMNPDDRDGFFPNEMLLGVKLARSDVKHFGHVMPGQAPDLLFHPTDIAEIGRADGSPCHYGYGTGCARRMWAFLATINDIPAIGKPVISLGHGFRARAQYRQFLSHKVLTLHVPEKIDRRRLARDIVAISKRRAHMVRGHWREDFRNPLAPLCEHSFEPRGNILHCLHCDGQRLFVREHQRGDSSIGFVSHDYKVVH